MGSMDLPQFWGFGLSWSQDQAVIRLGLSVHVLGSELPLGWPGHGLSQNFTWLGGCVSPSRGPSAWVEGLGLGDQARPEGPEGSLGQFCCDLFPVGQSCWLVGPLSLTSHVPSPRQRKEAPSASFYSIEKV